MNMTFDTASDDPLNGNSYFKMGGRMGWNEWFLGSIDFPLDMSSVNYDIIYYGPCFEGRTKSMRVAMRFRTLIQLP